jgi:2-oxoglutarate ferredoxin oxidoreductase subunit alpha
VPKAIVERHEGATYGVLTLGGCDLAVREALVTLAARGIPASFCRVRGFPFGDEVEAFLAEHQTIFVVEQNRDAQLRSLLTLETAVPKEKLRSVLAFGGFPLQATQVVDGITKQFASAGSPILGDARERPPTTLAGAVNGSSSPPPAGAPVHVEGGAE